MIRLQVGDYTIVNGVNTFQFLNDTITSDAPFAKNVITKPFQFLNDTITSIPWKVQNNRDA